jgi:hypothetical protein
MILGPESLAIDFLKQKHHMIEKLRENLTQAQQRIKKYADMKRLDRVFAMGDMVYLKLQPYRQHAFELPQHLKLMTKYYGPFKILENIGPAAYKLQLPQTADIHLVFHVSQLKKHIGAKVVPQGNLPLVTPEGYIKLEPVVALDTRALPRKDEIVTQWLVHWQNLTEEQATWEDKFFIKATFPAFYHQTLKEWWPNSSSCGQEQPQGGRSCQSLKPEKHTPIVTEVAGKE